MGHRIASSVVAAAPLLLSLAILTIGCQADRRYVVYVGQDQHEAVATMQRAYPTARIVTRNSEFFVPERAETCLLASIEGSDGDGVVMVCRNGYVKKLGVLREASNGVVAADGIFRPAVVEEKEVGTRIRRGMEYEELGEALKKGKIVEQIPDFLAWPEGHSKVTVPDGGTVLLGGSANRGESICYPEGVATDKTMTRLLVSRQWYSDHPGTIDRMFLLRETVAEVDCRKLSHQPPPEGTIPSTSPPAGGCGAIVGRVSGSCNGGWMTDRSR